MTGPADSPISGLTAATTLAGTDVLPMDITSGGATNTKKVTAELLTGRLNVRWYGALGDDSTDDTTAFNNAIAAAITLGHKAVYIPAGVYKLTSTITIHEGIALIGEESQGANEGLGVVLKHYSTSNLLVWDGNGATAAGTGGGLRNAILVKATGYSGGDAIKTIATDDNHRPGEQVFDNVLIFGESTGLWARGLHIDGTACTTAGSKGVRSTHLRKFRVADCTENNQYIYLNQAVHVYGDVEVDTGDGTGTLGITIAGDWDNILLTVRCGGNVVVNYSGSDNPTLNLQGVAGTLDINSTNIAGFAGIKSTAGSVTNQSALFKISSNATDAFMAYRTTTSANVTGNGATYTVPFTTEQFDQNSSYDTTTGIFTAKCAGLYTFSTQVVLDDLAAGNTLGQLELLHLDSGASTVHSFINQNNIGAIRDSGDAAAMGLSVVVRMAEGDSMRVRVIVSGGAGDTVDVVGAATQYTYFSGALLS